MDRPGMTLGRYLEQARRENGMSVRQLASVSGVHKTIISRLELGQVRSPRTDDLLRLAEVLELPSADVFLLAGIEIDQPPTVAALLRAEYDLPEAAVAEATKQIEAIVGRYAKNNKNRGEDTNGNRKHAR